MSIRTEPQTLSGCSVLPPMEPPAAPTKKATTPTNTKKAKGKTTRRKTGDRFATLNAFLDFTVAGLPRAAALTWLVLWRDTKPDGTAKTSIADVARRIGVNPSTVKRAVTALVKADLLTVIYRGSLRRGPSAYRVRPLPRERVTPTNPPPGR